MSAELSSSEDLFVGLDYGQFFFHTREEDPDLAVDLIAKAQGSEGIAQRGGLVVVLSPHQNNFRMLLRVEVWTAEPAADLAEWEEAFEVHLDVGAGGLVYESPTLEMTDIGVAAGSYYGLITGKGFTTHGWPGSTEPRDSWRLRLWPSPGPAQPARLWAFADKDVHRPSDWAVEGPLPGNSAVYNEAGEQERREHAAGAALRIAADLDHAQGARHLTGAITDAVVDVVLPRDRAALWPLFANLDITAVSAPNERAIDNEFAMHKSYRDADAFAGHDGAIVCRWTELEEPQRVAMTWQWVEGLPPGRPRLPHQARLDVTLTQLDSDNEVRPTRVVLTHSDIPVEWIEDMTTIWWSKFDQWVYQSTPKTRRRR